MTDIYPRDTYEVLQEFAEAVEPTDEEVLMVRIFLGWLKKKNLAIFRGDIEMTHLYQDSVTGKVMPYTPAR